MKKIAINEQALAERLGRSPKTLQRWHCDGRGPRYRVLPASAASGDCQITALSAIHIREQRAAVMINGSPTEHCSHLGIQ